MPVFSEFDNKNKDTWAHAVGKGKPVIFVRIQTAASCFMCCESIKS